MFVVPTPGMAVAVKFYYNLMWLIAVAHGLQMLALFTALMKRKQFFILAHREAGQNQGAM